MSNRKFDRCVNGSLRTRSSKTSPTHSRSRLTRSVLLTLSAAVLLAATPLQAEILTPVPSRDAKIVHRWSVTGDPHGLAIGRDGTLYVGLAQPQAVIAVDPKNGEIKNRVVLDKAEIAATKELVT